MSRPKSDSLTFVEAIGANPLSKAFRVSRHRSDDPRKWTLEPMDVPVLSDDGSGGGFFIVAALHVLPSGQIDPCFLDVSFPERINDYAYFVEGPRLVYGRTREYPGKIIPAIAFDCRGQYDTFYVETAPQIGIDILKNGLALAARKRYIARDLAYILRDEKHYQEAAEMFELVVIEEPGEASSFTFDELRSFTKESVTPKNTRNTLLSAPQQSPRRAPDHIAAGILRRRQSFESSRWPWRCHALCFIRFVHARSSVHGSSAIAGRRRHPLSVSDSLAVRDLQAGRPDLAGSWKQLLGHACGRQLAPVHLGSRRLSAAGSGSNRRPMPRLYGH